MSGGDDREGMANQGAKRRREENKQHMMKLTRIVVAANVSSDLRIDPIFFSATFTCRRDSTASNFGCGA